MSSYQLIMINVYNAGAVAQGGAIKAPCGAHVQQCTVKGIYINDIKEPKLKKDSLSYKENSGTSWPSRPLLSGSEKADMQEIRGKLVEKSAALHDSILRVEFFTCLQ